MWWRAENRFLLSAKRTSPCKSAGASVQSTTGSRGVRISSSNAGYTMVRGSAKGTGYLLPSPFSPSLPLRCVTVCHRISIGFYLRSGSSNCPHSQQVALERTKPWHVWMDLNPFVPSFYEFPFLQQSRRHALVFRQLIMPNLNKQ